MSYCKFWMTLVLIGALTACGAPRGPGSINAPSEAESEYVIGAGDELQIYVRNNPDLSVTLPVRPDGRISVPMVQDVRAAGKTPSTLAGELERELEAYIRNPNVTVMVRSFVGAYADQVRIIGQAVQPQAIPYRDGMTVLDAIIQAGGLTQFAAGNRARLVRGNGDDSRSFPLRLNDLVNSGDLRQNHVLRPGDILIIPEAYF
ncbi:MAG: XrtA/PEP-CTERM system exopolysaccharide export protein [Aquisalimonadaceae bacterium]